MRRALENEQYASELVERYVNQLGEAVTVWTNQRLPMDTS